MIPATRIMSHPTRLPPRSGLHPRHKCALCGSHKRELYKTYLYLTQSECWVCEDPIACLRSRKRDERVA